MYILALKSEPFVPDPSVYQMSTFELVKKFGSCQSSLTGTGKDFEGLLQLVFSGDSILL